MDLAAGKGGGGGRSAARVGGKLAATDDFNCALKAAISLRRLATTAARGASCPGLIMALSSSSFWTSKVATRWEGGGVEEDDALAKTGVERRTCIARAVLGVKMEMGE